MNKMKVTFITGHLCKERHALLYELALDLGEYGAEVTVVTGFPSRRISKEVRNYYLNNPVEKVSQNVTVIRVGSKKGEGNHLFTRMVKYFFLTRKLYKKALKIDTSVYYLYSSPFFLGYIGKKLRKKAPTLYNAQDLFPDTLVHTKGLSEKNPLIRFFRKKEKEVYLNNTHIVTISEQMKNTIVSQGADSSRVSVIYNWADIDNLHHVERSKNALFKELGLNSEKFIISYAGDLGLFQGWDNLLNVAEKLKKECPQIVFVLIGSGSYESRIKEIVEKKELSNVEIFPMQPASRLSEVYSIGDIELLPIEKGITKMALPSKNGVIMATGSPILAIVDPKSDIDNIVVEHSIGYSVPPENEDDLLKLILRIYGNSSNLSAYGTNARDFAEKNYSRKTQTKKYYDLLRGLSDGR